ncbi:MAG: type VI secretion system baseplate subunit TssE [Planctomycetaceae bacterium]|nr:type VI secretion system baseplate subunit TssE [Planctomycetaceae bacterium]
MSSGETSQSTIRLSILDRLLDDDPTNSKEVVPDDRERLRIIQYGLRRDLENLLNTRYRCIAWPPELDQIDNSLINYGIPDFTAASLNVAEEADFMLKAITQAISFFEPRLTDVSVVPVDNEDYYDRTFRFRIEATLQVEGGRHRVQFNSAMESATGQFDIN